MPPADGLHLAYLIFLDVGSPSWGLFGDLCVGASMITPSERRHHRWCRLVSRLRASGRRKGAIATPGSAPEGLPDRSVDASGGEAWREATGSALPQAPQEGQEAAGRPRQGGVRGFGLLSSNVCTGAGSQIP